MLRAAIRPTDPLTLLRAGYWYWIAILHAIGVVPDSDGIDLIALAVDLRPKNPEYRFFLALASFDGDREQYQSHWLRARELAKPGTAADKNIRLFEPILFARAKSLGRN